MSSAARPRLETPLTASTPSGASARVLGEVIAIHDARGRLLLSFDAATGALELRAGEGDLVLRAPAGRVLVEGESIDLRATDRTKLSGAVVELAAGAIELRASRVLERVVDVFREIEGTLHSKVGGVRTLVRGTFDLFARETRIASEEDTAIDGKHVFLG